MRLLPDKLENLRVKIDERQKATPQPTSAWGQALSGPRSAPCAAPRTPGQDFKIDQN